MPILTPDQLTAMLHHATPRLRPYIVICAFAALRPAECQRLKWENVKTGVGIYVPKAGAKTVARLVPILPVLAAWLEHFRSQQGPVCRPYSTWRKDFRGCVLAAKLLPWNQDALRHSAISYWLGIEPNRAAVAKWSANSEDVQKRDYDNPRSPEEAADGGGITGRKQSFSRCRQGYARRIQYSRFPINQGPAKLSVKDSGASKLG